MIDPNQIFEIKTYFELPNEYLDEDLINWLHEQIKNDNISIKVKKDKK